jgi:hypothetical protein
MHDLENGPISARISPANSEKYSARTVPVERTRAALDGWQIWEDAARLTALRSGTVFLPGSSAPWRRQIR